MCVFSHRRLALGEIQVAKEGVDLDKAERKENLGGWKTGGRTTPVSRWARDPNHANLILCGNLNLGGNGASMEGS